MNAIVEPDLGSHYVTYFDRVFKRQAAKINPGGYAVTSSDLLLVTVLGSCVAVCLYEPAIRTGGMNHFMLPGDGAGSTRGEGGMSALYGVNAMELLINGLLKQGGRKERMTAKVFGGGSVVTSMRDTRIGERNADFVRRYLARERIRVVSSDLLGPYPRKLCYFASTGRAFSKVLHAPEMVVEVGARERAYDGNLRRSMSQAGEVELF
ncbi:chemoreceptor glutamine deamidase CheD [Burkholderia ubonensis]|uniref:chemoreceptor glutamine deamidase CheD n=1 Tax=Burkholderia ubonensis TaxID=101571 RepID=UPI000754ABCD|nr:chemoreceptor glutamine deamidase CheD [Burkholderia ubonensis]KWB79389.1 chemotaxis protein CheD [Burkholderia ubonensis]